MSIPNCSEKLYRPKSMNPYVMVGYSKSIQMMMLPPRMVSLDGSSGSMLPWPIPRRMGVLQKWRRLTLTRDGLV